LLFTVCLACGGLAAELQPIPPGLTSSGVAREKEHFPLKCAVRIESGDVRRLVISLTNAGVVDVNVQRPWLANLQLRATRNGLFHKSLRNPKEIVDGGTPLTIVKPNQTADFFVELDGWFDLSPPGRYEFIGVYSVTPVVHGKDGWMIYQTTKFDFSVCTVTADRANKSLQPTPTAVMPPAAQEIMPAVGVAEH
jgi:hypothetical protein